MKVAKKKQTKASIAVHNHPDNKPTCQFGATHSLCFQKGLGLP